MAASAGDVETLPMFCFQCEQTNPKESAWGVPACTTYGLCAKDPELSALQDVLTYGMESLCCWAWCLEEKDFTQELSYLIAKSLFNTLTQVNFNPEDFLRIIDYVHSLRDKVAAKVKPGKKPTYPVASWNPAKDKAGLIKQARDYLIPKRFATYGTDRGCLRETMIIAFKGLAAYSHHAAMLGANIKKEMRLAARIVGDVCQRTDASVEELLQGCLETGELNLKVMELLDGALTTKYGHPEPTVIDWVLPNNAGAPPRPGKCVLISGHDLLELEMLLIQIENAGGDVNVYTHNEMMPTLAYPKFKKYPFLVGHYGTAWQHQKAEFEAFPGPILMTTNCFMPATPSYVKRVFSNAPTGGVGVTAIINRNYRPVIECARACAGFPEPDPARPAPGKKLTIGFARNTVMSVAGTVIDAVKAGALRHIFLVGGCDGHEVERNKFSEFAEAVPKDCLILTLGCGKFKVIDKDYGTLGNSGIPRLLDMGQCNDAYSAIQVAIALAGAFKCGVNDLPLSLVISWFEQKAVAILLTLLHLGIKNIYVGPRVPAFFTPTILKVLIENYSLHVLTDVPKDMEALLHK